MRGIILYRPNTDHERSVIEYETVFEREGRGVLELMSLDTREGAELAALYQAMAYPSLVVIDDRGGLQQLWQGPQLPLMQEVSYYLRIQS